MRSSLSNRFSALENPLYRRYWFGSMASVGASQLMVVGQAWLVFDLSQSALMLGVLGAAASLPTIVVSLFGGALADQMDKRKIIIATSLVNALLMLLLAALIYTETVSVWHIILIAGVSSFVSGLDWPCRQAFFPLLVEKKEMLSAVALNSILWQATRMALPAAGGILLAYYSPGLVFVLCSAGFLLMVPALVKITYEHQPGHSTDSTFVQIKEGFVFITEQKLFLILILLTYTSMFFGMSYMSLLPAFSSLLSLGPKGYGFLMAATGIGSVLGTFATGYIDRTKPAGNIMIAASAAAGFFIYLLCALTVMAEGLPYSGWVVGFVILCASLLNSVFVLSAMTTLQLNVPDKLRGRVMGIHSLCYSLMPLGSLFLGGLATWVGVPGAVATGITVYLVFLMAIWLFREEVQQIHLT
ncbi:MAG: MFS transporter [Gammaproteobacteria bacterium]|nr:MFS transporter [Gammaproteobacteria bacterium]